MLHKLALEIGASSFSSVPRNFRSLGGVQCSVRTNLAKSFVAVISGNAIYFLLLMPLLPPAARHQPYKIDLGLLVDFWVCLACYGIVELISRRMRSSARDAQPRD